MRIILSPAKQMIDSDYAPDKMGVPVFSKKSKVILEYLKDLSYADIKALWGTSDKIAIYSYEKLSKSEITRNLSPALLTYDGIAFKYMSPVVFDNDQYSYVENHLRILSGLYGVLKPMDGICFYRLEMQAKTKIKKTKDLYEYWGKDIYDEITKDNDDGIIINLASKEYSKCVEKYLEPKDNFITCEFGELDLSGKVIQKGVYCKMARGEMVRYMAENQIEDINAIKNFTGLGYRYNEDLSSENLFIFIRNGEITNEK